MAQAWVRERKKWITNNLGIGGTWLYEQRDGNDYEIKGTDITLKRSNETFIKGEFAQSDSTQTSGSYVSTDGGLTFDAFDSNDGESSGRAFGIEARASITDFVRLMPSHSSLDSGPGASKLDFQHQ